MSDPAGQENEDMTTTEVRERADDATTGPRCSLCGLGPSHVKEELVSYKDDQQGHPLCIAAEAPPVQQPADVVSEETLDKSGVLELRTPRGMLTIRPDQKSLDAEQKAGLLAIGIDIEKDPGIVPHVRPFIHMCQVRGLDPYVKEAYLIGRGEDKYRTYTMQTGIDGYMKMAGSTGRFVRIADILWTGKEDDDRFWRMDSNGVMRRVYWDQWPESRGWPGSSRVVVEYFTEDGILTSTAGTADWLMYAPLVPKWTGPKGNRSKALGPDGKPILKLNDMWEKGYAHMLAKCLPYNARVHTDRGPLRIGEIVTKRLPVKVRSIDLDTGAEVWQPVTGWWTNPATTDWVRLWTPNGSRGNKPVRTTHDHPVWTPDGWVKAGEISEGDLVAVTSPTLSPQQRQIILGGLLGDASLAGRHRASTQPHFAVSHSTKQADYLRWTAAALTNLATTVQESTQTDGTGKAHPVIRLRTATAAALYQFRQMSPVEWLSQIDDLGLAVWLMDDGSIRPTDSRSRRPSLAIHCCGFGVDFADAAVEWFRDRYGVTAKVLRRERNPYLVIGVDDTEVILACVSPYLVADGARKEWVAGPVEQGHEHGMAFVPVLRVEHVRTRYAETRYDIEVEGTHTFVTNGLVVSNCARALTLRLAFPAKMSGIYMHEELHRADQIERDRLAGERRVARQEAFAAAQERRAISAPPDTPKTREQAVVRGESEQESSPSAPMIVQPDDDVRSVTQDPVHVSDAVRETVDAMRTAEPQQPPKDVPSEEQRLTWLRSELEWLADLLGPPIEKLAARQMTASGKALGELTADELLKVALQNRPSAITRMRSRGQDEEADAYAAAPPVAMPRDTLLGYHDADPGQPHSYVDAGGVCRDCERFDDDPIHAPQVT